MQIRRMADRRVVIAAAVAGAVSGIVSYVVMMYLPSFLQFPFPIALGNDMPTGVSVIPGILFGVVVACVNWKFGVRDKFHLGLIVGFTLGAWVLAVNVTQLAYAEGVQYTKTTPAAAVQLPDVGSAGEAGSAEPVNEKFPFVPALAGMIGGLIGGLGTLLGVVIVNVAARRLDGLLPITVAATVLGLVLQAAFLSDDLFGKIGYASLFVLWQASVAALIARGLAGGTVENRSNGMVGPVAANGPASLLT